MRKLNLYITAVMALLMNTGCSGQGFDFEGMESAEKKWNERTSQELLAFMSLETMFPDESARALAKAAGKGKVKKVEELVRSGVDVNARGTQEATPLFWAMKNYKGFKRLLELGADPNVIYGDGGTVVYWAVEMKDMRFLEAVLEHGGNPNLASGDSFGNTPIFAALGEGEEKIDRLLKAGANIDAKNNFGSTPAMTAAGRGRFDLVYYLLERGADYNVVGENGETLATRVADKIGMMDPKHELARWQKRVVDWLESRGVEVKKRS